MAPDLLCGDRGSKVAWGFYCCFLWSKLATSQASQDFPREGTNLLLQLLD